MKSITRLLIVSGVIALHLNVSGCATPASKSRHAPAPIFEANFAPAPSQVLPESVLPSQPPPVVVQEPALEAVQAEPAATPMAPLEEELTAPIHPAKPATAAIKTHPAALALMHEASRQEKEGDLETAAAKLERALRIEPRNAKLWNRLAEIRLRQGQTQLAANLAAKSNSFAAQDIDLTERNRRIIHRAQGR